MSHYVPRPAHETTTQATRCGLSLVSLSGIRRLAGLIIVGALLILSGGCAKTTITEDDVESKQRQIMEATEKLLDGPIPADEQRG